MEEFLSVSKKCWKIWQQWVYFPVWLQPARVEWQVSTSSETDVLQFTTVPSLGHFTCLAPSCFNLINPVLWQILKVTTLAAIPTSQRTGVIHKTNNSYWLDLGALTEYHLYLFYITKKQSHIFCHPTSERLWVRALLFWCSFLYMWFPLAAFIICYFFILHLHIMEKSGVFQDFLNMPF